MSRYQELIRKTQAAEGDVREELFHLRTDANEQNNRARDPSAQTTLEQMRAALERLAEGPLRPERFNP